MLIVFLGMGYTLLNCALGPAPENHTDAKFQDNFFMVLPIALALLLTLILGIHTPQFLTDWVQEGAAFLHRMPME
jgi:hypothetical protein